MPSRFHEAAGTADLLESMSGAHPLCRDSACVRQLDPLRDSRWPEFLERHSQASVFHTPGWLRALRRSYGYEPLVFTTSAPGQPLENGIVVCRITSWLTGSRLVSLPFSDHCQPLLDRQEHWAVLFREIQRQLAARRGRYLELRPSSSTGIAAGLFKSSEYCLHRLDLTPGSDALFRNFHKSCIQRKIRRAEREGMAYEAGRSALILQKFYGLLQLTRRRHRLPPQPFAWFRNLIDCLGGSAAIHLAQKDGRPVAGVLTLRYKRTLVYKYGCSDERFHNLGGMPWLFWQAIQDAKERGAEEFDLGRTDCDNAGLIAFKDHLGAARSTLIYYKHPGTAGMTSMSGRARQIVGNAFAAMPGPLLRAAGKLFYRHVG